MHHILVSSRAHNIITLCNKIWRCRVVMVSCMTFVPQATPLCCKRCGLQLSGYRFTAQCRLVCQTISTYLLSCVVMILIATDNTDVWHSQALAAFVTLRNVCRLFELQKWGYNCVFITTLTNPAVCHTRIDTYWVLPLKDCLNRSFWYVKHC